MLHIVTWSYFLYQKENKNIILSICNDEDFAFTNHIIYKIGTPSAQFAAGWDTTVVSDSNLSSRKMVSLVEIANIV